MASDTDEDVTAPNVGAARRAGAKSGPKAKAAAGAQGAAKAAKPVKAGAGAEGDTQGSAPLLRKKDLLDRVGEKSKAKKKDIKDVVEATLLVMGEALARGEELNLPPLGKAKVNRQKGVNGGDMYIIKLRRGAAKADARTDALADTPD